MIHLIHRKQIKEFSSMSYNHININQLTNIESYKKRFIFVMPVV